jgi:hypothetical protein
MGNEANSTITIGKRKTTGKALLETSELLFRPSNGSPRLKIAFASIKSAKAVDGKLQLETPDGKVSLELGPAAAKWCEKILHPKSRIEKLGVKAESEVAIVGNFDDDFLKELRHATQSIPQSKISAASDVIFLSTASRPELNAILSKVKKSISGSTALWIVYPKGQKEITENDVLSIGRKAGLKDVKVVGFSPTHTALKFVIPVSER